MHIFLTFLKYGLGLLPSIVLGIQTVAGDKATGADKKTMAIDTLNVALQGAAGVITDPTQAALAQGAAGTVASLIGAIGAINAAVTHTKATGQYQQATAVAAQNAGVSTGSGTTGTAMGITQGQVAK